jgi:hypothetical protein
MGWADEENDVPKLAMGMLRLDAWLAGEISLSLGLAGLAARKVDSESRPESISASISSICVVYISEEPVLSNSSSIEKGEASSRSSWGLVLVCWGSWDTLVPRAAEANPRLNPPG